MRAHGAQSINLLKIMKHKISINLPKKAIWLMPNKIKRKQAGKINKKSNDDNIYSISKTKNIYICFSPVFYYFTNKLL